jgi:hypothetical protein
VFASSGVMSGLNILLSLHRLSRGRMTYFKARPLQTQTLPAMPKIDNDTLKRELSILQWSEIRDRFSKSDLFLGNGFSIQISDRLNYASLFDKFLELNEQADKDIFRQFSTTNFESILEKINNALSVNRIFGIDSGQLESSIPKLRNGLIESINQNHPRHADIDNSIFERLSASLDEFEDVFTTNYDTFLYRVVMKTKDRYDAGEKIRPYQDYFWLRQGDYLRFMDTQDDNTYKNFYFLHGALFIFRTDYGNFKIRRGDRNTELLDIISEKITANEFPLFVTEGTFQDKENTINGNGYLSFCRTNFKNTARSLVIYGSSLSAQDSHLINDLNYNRRELAISVRCQDKSIEQLRHLKLDTLAKFNRFKNEEIVFYDSDSLF